MKKLILFIWLFAAPVFAENGVFDIADYGAIDGANCTNAISTAITLANSYGTLNARGIVTAPVGFDTAYISGNALPEIDCNIDFKWLRCKLATQGGVLFTLNTEPGKHRTINIRLVEGYGQDVYQKPFPTRYGTGISVKNKWYSDVEINIIAGFQRNIDVSGASGATGAHDNTFRVNTCGWANQGVCFWASSSDSLTRVEFIRMEIDYMVRCSDYYLGLFNLSGNSRVQDNIIDIIGIEQHEDETNSRAIVLYGENVFRNRVTIHNKIMTPAQQTWHLYSVQGAHHNIINLPTCDGTKMRADAQNIYNGDYAQPGTIGPGVMAESRGVSYLSSDDPTEFNNLYLGVPTICWNSGAAGPVGWFVVTPGKPAMWGDM